MSAAAARVERPVPDKPDRQSVGDFPCNVKGMPYMPLKLKGVIARLGLKQTSVAQAVTQQGRKAGHPLGYVAFTQLLNWDTWPKETPAAAIKQQVEAFLRTQGADDQDMALCWQHDRSDATRGAQPAGCHAGQKSSRWPAAAEYDIDLPETEMLTPTAKKHFSLFRDPFTDDVQSSEDLFLSADCRYIREAMYTTAKHGGFLAVVGESGSGKTTIRRDLLDRIARENAPISVVQPRAIDKASLSASMICEAIIQDLRPGESMRRTMEGKARQVEKLLIDSSRAGNTHVLMIEEAHDLTVKTLKLLKRFWELEDGFRKLLSIILVGQPELKRLLDERQNFEAREVIRRCEIAELVPLDRNLEDYLALKFKRVGGTVGAALEPSAYDAIRSRLTARRGAQRTETVSMVYPLVVNNLVTRAMNVAAELGVPKVNGDVIAQI